MSSHFVGGIQNMLTVSPTEAKIPPKSSVLDFTLKFI